MMKPLLLLLLSILVYSVSAEEINCQQARNTIEVNECARIELSHMHQTMSQYLHKSIERYSDDPEMVSSIQASQTAWLEFSEKHCNATFTKWRTGTIRTVMALDCDIRLTQERTHQLWLDFLTYMDSTKPVLPEPALP